MGEPSCFVIIQTAMPIRVADAPSMIPTRRRSVDGDGVSGMFSSGFIAHTIAAGASRG